MSGSKNPVSFNWLIVEWKRGSRNVVHVKSVVSPLDEEPRPGDAIKVNWHGEPKTATFIAHARDRDTLDAMVKESVKMEARPNCKSEASSIRTYEEGEDFSSSGSSWVPSAAEGSAESDTGNTRVKLKMRKQSDKTPTVIRKYSKRKRTNLLKIMSSENVLPDSTQWPNREEVQNDEVLMDKLNEVENSFTNILKLIENIERQCAKNQNSQEKLKIQIKPELSETPNEQSVHEDEGENSDELNRSTDNVLITNKYNLSERNERVEDELVPIGSGKTLIPKDKLKKVNWRSYTIATRTLLLALFPRRILATHSLTGKKSPAFQTKTVKMCLDPKIISDVIIEITERFNVQANIVRKIITTKCADECKMYRTRKNKKKPQNDENVPPTNNNSDEENIDIL